MCMTNAKQAHALLLAEPDGEDWEIINRCDVDYSRTNEGGHDPVVFEDGSVLAWDDAHGWYLPASALYIRDRGTLRFSAEGTKSKS